jgi:hypothetical protein
MSIYSSHSSQLGAAQIGGQLGVVAPAEAAKADREIKQMRGALQKWLKYRVLMNTPKSDMTPVEQRLGQQLYVLLSEMFDPQSLPPASDPVRLAAIAVSGKLPTEGSQSAVGAFWVWPAVAVVGLVLMTVVTKIKSDAAAAADERRIQCIEAGKCTDTGFWLKLGGIVMVGWFAWEKLGLKKMVSKIG